MFDYKHESRFWNMLGSFLKVLTNVARTFSSKILVVLLRYPFRISSDTCPCCLCISSIFAGFCVHHQEPYITSKYKQNLLTNSSSVMKDEIIYGLTARIKDCFFEQSTNSGINSLGVEHITLVDRLSKNRLLV